ncbi:MAG TPA: sulfur carrier protein ThiS [Candidatus Kapabacteria bacterium]|jgi:sulfur carrier protein
MTNIIIGNEQMRVNASRVSELLPALDLPSEGRGIAIAVNDSIVSRSRWQEHELRDGDRIEIVRAVQGG